jgi:hypothetical protein
VTASPRQPVVLVPRREHERAPHAGLGAAHVPGRIVPRMARCAAMSVSQLISEPARCPVCGHVCVPAGWSVVDFEERPDLQAELADDTWRTWRCPLCDAAVERRAPLLLLQLSAEAPVVLGVSDDELAADDPVGPHRDLLDRTVAALGIRRQEIPGPGRHRALRCAGRRCCA